MASWPGLAVGVEALFLLAGIVSMAGVSELGQPSTAARGPGVVPLPMPSSVRGEQPSSRATATADDFGTASRGPFLGRTQGTTNRLVSPQGPVISIGVSTVGAKSIPVGSHPLAVAYDSANECVYVANVGSDYVTVITPSTTTPKPATFLGLPPAGGYALVAGVDVLALVAALFAGRRRGETSAVPPTTPGPPPTPLGDS